MKKVRMILSGALVIAVVSGALAFKTKQTPNLFQCNTNNKCVPAQASDIGGTDILNVNLFYKVSNSSTFVCPLPNDATKGCQTHPQQAFKND